MHRGGVALPGASVDELGPLPCKPLSTPTGQVPQGQAGVSPCALLVSFIKWAMQPFQQARRRHLAHGWCSLQVKSSVPDP